MSQEALDALRDWFARGDLPTTPLGLRQLADEFAEAVAGTAGLPALTFAEFRELLVR